MTEAKNVSRKALLFNLELVWWLFTAIIVAAILYPILSRLPDYPFLILNILFIAIFITISRYIFLLKYTFFAFLQRFKVVLAFLCIPLLFFLVQEITNFQTYIDENGVDALVGNLPYGQRDGMINYIRNEMLLFGVGSAIGTVIFFFRLILSVWRVRNRGRA